MTWAQCPYEDPDKGEAGVVSVTQGKVMTDGGWDHKPRNAGRWLLNARKGKEMESPAAASGRNHLGC